MINVVAKSITKAESIDNILVLLEELVEKTLKEEGCIKYQLFQDVKDPKVMIFLEEWASEEALNKHMASEHFKRIVPQLNMLREKASEVNVCKKLLG